MEWANYPSIRYNYLTSLPNARKNVILMGLNLIMNGLTPLGKIGIVTPYMAERFRFS